MSSLIHNRRASEDSITKYNAHADEPRPQGLDADPDFGDFEQPEINLTPADKKALLTKALEIDPGVEAWSWRGIRNLLIVLTVALCSSDSGLDGTVMGGINSMAQYQEYFGLPRPRWLYATGKSREAHQVLARLHSSDGNVDSPLVALEMSEIKEKISVSGADMVIYSFGWTTTKALYPTETLSYESRAKGLAFADVIVQACTCINTFALPVALASMGWKVYIIFLAWDSFEVLMIYLFLPETKGLTLEEIDDKSDPGVFTTLARRMGMKNLEVVEVYDIESWAIDHLQPRGLFFCFLWRKDYHKAKDFKDRTAGRVWFANQVIDDACASQAIINVALNCTGVDIGDSLREFKADTLVMSPVMKGLSISNFPLVREAHNSLARPADLRGSKNHVANVTMDEVDPKKKKRKQPQIVEKTDEETYHFVGYVPAFGKVWELVCVVPAPRFKMLTASLQDGLKSGPLEVGELTHESQWMDVVRPVIKQKMRKYGGSGEDASDIRFNLLALVDDRYQISSDKLELLKREKAALERRLDEAYPEGWADKVDPAVLAAATESFATSVQPAENGRVYAKDFGEIKVKRAVEICDLSVRGLIPAWEACVRNAMSAKVEVEDEISKATLQETEHAKRTFDYEPFFDEFIKTLHAEGLLNPLLGRDANGKKIPANRKGKKKAAE
ncbi:hypothetical protein HWV62_5239 [Athelia sp. TMB]|nr:hypothetical protein HWV62_5239 [Athelia sp. TMB]